MILIEYFRDNEGLWVPRAAYIKWKPSMDFKFWGSQQEIHNHRAISDLAGVVLTEIMREEIWDTLTPRIRASFGRRPALALTNFLKRRTRTGLSWETTRMAPTRLITRVMEKRTRAMIEGLFPPVTA